MKEKTLRVIQEYKLYILNLDVEPVVFIVCCLKTVTVWFVYTES